MPTGQAAAATTPAVTVCMAVRDARAYLDAAITSITGQDFTDFELLVVDDGSTDDSGAILAAHARRDGRIRHVCRENRGIARTRQEMLERARGRYVAVLDADDLASPQRLLRQCAYLDEHPAVVAVGSAYRVIDDKGRFLTRLSPPPTDGEIQDKLVRGHCSILHSAAMFRRQAALEVGGYAEDLSTVEDLDLWLRLGEVGQLANLTECLASYRVHDRSVSATVQLGQRAIVRRVCERAAERRGEPCRFDAVQPWRALPTRASRYEFKLKYGWWAYGSSEFDTSLGYAAAAIGLMPWRSGGWRLLYVSLFRRRARMPAPG